MPANDVLARDRAIDVRSIARRADWIRQETIRLVEIAGSGHYSSVFSCAEILAALYYKVLRAADLRRDVAGRVLSPRDGTVPVIVRHRAVEAGPSPRVGPVRDDAAPGQSIRTYVIDEAQRGRTSHRRHPSASGSGEFHG